jgi:uncharacterized protein YkwD
MGSCGGVSNRSQPGNWGPPGGQGFNGAENRPPPPPPPTGDDASNDITSSDEPVAGNEQPADPASTTPAAGMDAKDKELLDAINRVRKEHGLNALTSSETLNQASRDNDALNNQVGLGHHVDLGKYGADGEITGWASAGMTADQAVQMWLDSPGHRAILLDPNQTQVGVSVDGAYATADFI